MLTDAILRSKVLLQTVGSDSRWIVARAEERHLGKRRLVTWQRQAL